MKRLFFLLVIALLGIAGYVYFFHWETTPKVHYITESVKRGNLEKSVLATGSVRAYQRTEVGAQVSGKILKLHVSLGQAVQRGDLIAEIDAETQQNNLSTAQAQLAAQKTQLNARQVALSVAEANYQRLSRLYTQKSTSQMDLDTSKNNLALARANLEDTKAQIQVAEIAVNTARTHLSYSKIVAPMAGVVVSVPVSEGQTVNSNQTSPTLVQIADLSKALIKLEIAEGDIDQVKAQQAVTFTTLSDPSHRYEGKIQSVDPALTALTDNNYSEISGNSNAVYYYANVVVDNPHQKLRIGMTTEGKVIIAEKQNVLIVPNTALKKRGKAVFVEVLENDVVQEKAVKTGLGDNQFTEITEGLKEGEKVITAQRAEGEKVGSSRIRF
ncbi:efflux transporter periplasmic adaptor subunit [Pasteurellaceae bacterium Macca]|nr:efflux transporter periplasmic adaptor subunit [Pasteurellaceae bacterium Macca]